MHNFRLPLIRELQAQGFDVTAIGSGGDGYDTRLLEAGVDFRPVPISRRGLAPLMDLLLLVRLVLFFRRERPQVFHAFTIKPAIYGTLAAALAGVPVRVVTITGLGHAFTTASGALRRVVEILYRAALRRATRVYFQNSDDRAEFLARGLVSEEKTRLIAGSGVDTRKFAVEPLPSITGAPLTFLMVARLIREKGVLEYLAAAKSVRASNPQIGFTLLGGLDTRNPSGLTKEEVETLTAKGDVRWFDEVSDVRPHLAACDVLILPSYREGMPRAVLEAAAMGRAAIVTDVPGCRDAVESGVTGLIVPAMDSQALAAGMLELAATPSRAAEMGAAARRRVEAKFDEHGVIKQTIAAYTEMISRE